MRKVKNCPKLRDVIYGRPLKSKSIFARCRSRKNRHFYVVTYSRFCLVFGIKIRRFSILHQYEVSSNMLFKCSAEISDSSSTILLLLLLVRREISFFPLQKRIFFLGQKIEKNNKLPEKLTHTYAHARTHTQIHAHAHTHTHTLTLTLTRSIKRTTVGSRQ